MSHRTPETSQRLGAGSPTNMSPGQAKEELHGLNDRLAGYIEKVLSLKEENTKLTAEINVIKITKQEEVDNLRSWTEKELWEAKKKIALLQNENKENAALADEYRKKLDKEVEAHKKTSDALKATQRKLSDKEGQLAIVKQEVMNLEAVVQELRKECQKLKEALESAKYVLEQERRTRVELENKLQLMEDELNSKKETHKKEILELKQKFITIESETDSRYKGIYQEKLQEVRDSFAKEFEELKTVREEKSFLSTKVENLKSELSQLQSKNTSLVLKIEDLETLRAGDQRRAAETIANRDAQILELRENLQRVEEELKLEILSYEKMLEGEEERLKIGHKHGKRGKSGRQGAVKRLRLEEATTEFRYSSQGYIQIKEVNVDGKYVKLFNSGSKNVPLGGWSVERSVDGKTAIGYKFSAKYVLKAGCYVTIWASQGGGQHKPPTDLIFRQKASWGVGTETKTVLRDADGQEAASAVSEEVSVVRCDETDSRRVVAGQSNEAATTVSEEARVIRTDETGDRGVTTRQRDGGNGKPCIIQ